MTSLRTKGKVFAHFPYSFGKHKLYGFKIDIRLT
ncbi:hypothetical protein H310_15072 [Aphanomyces invadans]|uniref:Uncharacterized protein n=1 Tax=Aphanomyces invadans TaxID=157072 RepID=A0A024T7U4_9STRA|nr:hypothetical protein H310_15072 [Aphanomyces invadans]ETV90095.1 hypothetical protein H310_15072 [Aphanomyces invadans]|eukprot:XP_008881272.1 hypothetical protein H310_15072 [Aphanomyces invadans]